MRSIVLVLTVIAFIAISLVFLLRMKPGTNTTNNGELSPVVPPVDTTFVGLDTTPHDALRALVDTSDPDLDDPTSFDRDVTIGDAEFIIDQLCRRASSGTLEFARGNVISFDTVSMGILGTMVRAAAIVHTKTQSIRFATIVEWNGSYASPPVVRSVTFDELEPNQGHLVFDTYEFAPAENVDVV